MNNNLKPHFIIKDKFQKREILYSEILSKSVLEDVCKKVTGKSKFTYEFDEYGYNKGRLAKLEYKGKVNYISFSETEVKSRNSSFQSISSALNIFHMDESKHKVIYFYFLPSSGNIETNYFIFMYRLMKTAGIKFLNEDENLKSKIARFVTIEDVINNRNLNRGKNKANNSTHLTKSIDDQFQIYGKTYGASKYETTLLCIALSNITKQGIELYQICEGSLKVLPASSREVIEKLGKIKIITTDLTLNPKEILDNDSLRSPAYIFNLLEKYGDKKCAFCDCKIPQIIQGAHIWPVSDIKKSHQLSQATKLKYAIDADNGIWLCQNHHKLLDSNILKISNKGVLMHQSKIGKDNEQYISSTIINHQLSDDVVTEGLLCYLAKRNAALKHSSYISLS